MLCGEIGEQSVGHLVDTCGPHTEKFSQSTRGVRKWAEASHQVYSKSRYRVLLREEPSATLQCTHWTINYRIVLWHGRV